MRYLLLGCDAVGGPPLWDESEGPSDTWPVEPSADLQESIIDWNERMGAIVRRPEGHTSAELATLLKMLNEEGHSFANRLNAEMGSQVKVRYLPEPE